MTSNLDSRANLIRSESGARSLGVRCDANHLIFKILPASDCAPEITLQFRPKSMIPIDQGEEGGGRGNPNINSPTPDAKTCSRRHLLLSELLSLNYAVPFL